MKNTALKEANAAPRTGTARKLARSVEPTMVERFFDENEIIVSKTDLKGRLTYVNRVFMQISAYDKDKLVGQPHSVIRHPDMPRAVFKFMWERLGQGAEIFAYVKNMASTGDFYWVLAHVTPSVTETGDVVGYHSNRRVPDRRIVDETIVPLYRTLSEIESGAPDRRAGLEMSYARLQAILGERGADYDEFIHSL